MTARISLSTFAKTTTFTITLLTCQGCLVVPPSTPFPTPVILGEKSEATQLEAGWENTCSADALTQSQASKVSGSSKGLEATADKLAGVGKHKEAIRKYNEAEAVALNEAIAEGRRNEVEKSVIRHSGDLESFRKENRLGLEKSAGVLFKLGQSYAQLGKLESALDCFNGTLKLGILPPNDAITYLNRGDAYERMGVKGKAKADFQQAANLFKKHKLPSYEKLAQKRLQAVTK
jgi:tetratricopeptide (TPR) repeat protein